MTENLYPIATEQALIGAILTTRTIETIRSTLTPADFSNVETQAAYTHIEHQWQNGEHFDQITTAAAPNAANIETLNAWQLECWPSAAGDYARIVAAASQMRALALNVAQLKASIMDGEIVDPDIVADELKQIATRHQPLDINAASMVRTMGDFVADAEAEPERHEWLLPNYIRRRWRIVIAGEEGIGKMVLLRQVGHCIAAGLHPFKQDTPITPRRVLYVDVENPADTIAEQAKLISNYHDLTQMAGDRLMIHSNEAGINLAQPADRRRFEQIVAHTQPDIVIAGPLYKLSRRATGGHSDWDADAMDLINFFDDIRTRHNCAIMLEHHLVKSGQNAHFRSTDQGGSAMFRRWPEMSFSMVTDPEAEDAVKLFRYRRSRNTEAWPERIKRRDPGATQTGFAWSPEWATRQW